MRQKRSIIYPAIIAVLTTLLILSHLSTPAIAQPGTTIDPLVTQRYVDEQIAILQAQIDALQNQTGQSYQANVTLSPDDMSAIITEVTNAVNASQVIPFTPLFMPAGSRLIAAAGVELILRSGEAAVMAGPNGLVDVTAGNDIADGQPISPNHLVLVPADGRGLYFTSDSWLMIKGGYIIVNE